jgi:ribose-phosphate pyrophosphokinase
VNLSNAFSVLAGSANPHLAAAIARELEVEVGACTLDRFPDGEIMVQLNVPVRRKEVFIVQPTSPPVNDHLIELLAIADACRRASAATITAVVPYFGYARADKRHGRREPVTGRVVADLLQAVGVGHVVAVDLHTPQIEGFFHVPVDSLTAVPVLCQALAHDVSSDLVIVSTDVGRIQMAASYAQCFGLPVTVLHKRRDSGSQTEVTRIVGDVEGRPCLIVDDIISTGGTLAESIRTLMSAGARPEIMIAATHGPLLASARDKLYHPAVREILVTDTVCCAEKDWPRLHVVSVAPLIARAIKQFLADGSLDEVYGEPLEGAKARRVMTHEATLLS